jgi:hypothetical protein
LYIASLLCWVERRQTDCARSLKFVCSIKHACRTTVGKPRAYDDSGSAGRGTGLPVGEVSPQSGPLKTGGNRRPLTADKPTRGTLAQAPGVGYHKGATESSWYSGLAIEEAAMLSPAQEARILDILGDCPSGTLRNVLP